jgi:hypothetical protein
MIDATPYAGKDPFGPDIGGYDLTQSWLLAEKRIAELEAERRAEAGDDGGGLMTLCLPPASGELLAREVQAEVEARLSELHERGDRPAPDCGSQLVTLRRLDDPRRGRAVHVRCNRLRCGPCWLRIRSRQIRHGLDCCLREVPDGGLPPASDRRPGEAPGLPAREADLYVWRGGADAWEAKQKRVHRRGAADGLEYGYLRVERSAGRVVVITECPLSGAGTVTPAEAARMAAELIENAPLRKGAVSWGGRWKRRSAPRQYKRLDLAVPTRIAADWAAMLDAEVKSIRPRQRDSGLVRGHAWRLPADMPAEALELYYKAIAGTGLGDLRKAVQAWKDRPRNPGVGSSLSDPSSSERNKPTNPMYPDAQDDGDPDNDPPEWKQHDPGGGPT